MLLTAKQQAHSVTRGRKGGRYNMKESCRATTKNMDVDTDKENGVRGRR